MRPTDDTPEQYSVIPMADLSNQTSNRHAITESL